MAGKITAAVTGHRPNKLFGYDLMDPRYTAIRKTVQDILRHEKATDMWTGMALGTDMLAALAVIGMQDAKPKKNIRLHAAIPFEGHKDRRWPQKTQDLYDAILSRCDEAVTVTDGGYSPWAMELRNRYMCDRADFLIAVYNGATGGTANCIRYARTLGIPIWFVDPSDPSKPVRVPDDGRRFRPSAKKASAKKAPGLYTGSFGDIDPDAYDEIWLTVRGLKSMPANPKGNITHVPLLSPSTELWHRYLRLRDAKKWDKDAFENIYTPVFLQEMLQPQAHAKLRELHEAIRTKSVLCVCYCSDESLCHRSLIRLIMQAMDRNAKA